VRDARYGRVVAQRAPPGDEGDAVHALVLLDSENLHEAQLEGRGDMRAAAGRIVDAVYLDDPEFLLPLGRPFAQGKGSEILGRTDVGREGIVLGDDLVHPRLGLGEVALGQGRTFYVYGRAFRAEME
jgi:hypothetical protein